ncbi:MAG: hypothetical protein FWE69_03770 [Clostridiales bacterium]|nr:hypothetical protein [Clostridiales bacterium]
MDTLLRIANLKQPLACEDAAFLREAAAQLRVRPEQISHLRIVRQAVDARDKRDIHFSTHIEIRCDAKTAAKILGDKRLRAEPVLPKEKVELRPGAKPLRGRVVVVGLGPAGLFAAWQLAAQGYRPLVLERGKPVAERTEDVETYWQTGKLNTESNVAFGEGGAGTFSDGKLTTRVKDGRVAEVLARLVACGAPEEILIAAKPHLGTDRLTGIVSAMRQEIARLGGEVWFSSKLTGLIMRDGALSGITVERNGQSEKIETNALALAIGQAARDTYRMLHEAGVALAPKAFAVGLRIEHPQDWLNRSQYGDFWAHPRLGAAEYRLTGRAGGRGIYTFCMCPGGLVVAAASDINQVVVNGMSRYARDGANANSAVVAQVGPSDFGADPLAGLAFCERLEEQAYRLGGESGFAPAQRLADFYAGQKTKAFAGIQPTYRPGVVPADLRDCLPDFIADGIREGLLQFDRQLRGFADPDAVLTAVESRTSAPLRILRDARLQSPSHPGLWPVGEGAGWAGGIVSAAADGLKAAEEIIKTFARGET